MKKDKTIVTIALYSFFWLLIIGILFLVLPFRIALISITYTILMTILMVYAVFKYPNRNEKNNILWVSTYTVLGLNILMFSNINYKMQIVFIFLIIFYFRFFLDACNQMALKKKKKDDIE